LESEGNVDVVVVIITSDRERLVGEYPLTPSTSPVLKRENCSSLSLSLTQTTNPNSTAQQLREHELNAVIEHSMFMKKSNRLVMMFICMCFLFWFFLSKQIVFFTPKIAETSLQRKNELNRKLVVLKNTNR
jgi:hypothetical protein